MTTQTVGYKAKAFEPRNLAFFFLIAFGLTWIKDALTVIFDMKMPTSITDPVILFVVFVGIPGTIGPTFAAFVMSAISEGKPRVRCPIHHQRYGGGIWMARLCFTSFPD